MIIYVDAISGDEVVSDTFKIVENEEFPLLWETDCRKYIKRGNDDFQLEGANPSAEDAVEEDSGEGEGVMVHDIEDQFRLNWLKTEDGAKPSKADYSAHMKKYLKELMKIVTPKINDRVAEHNASVENEEDKLTEAGELKKWQVQAAGALKKITKNWDNYDVMMGESMNGEAMYVLIDFREDGVTPFATLWKDGLKETKV